MIILWSILVGLIAVVGFFVWTAHKKIRFMAGLSDKHVDDMRTLAFNQKSLLRDLMTINGEIKKIKKEIHSRK